jgi:hypothetical protein
MRAVHMGPRIAVLVAIPLLLGLTACGAPDAETATAEQRDGSTAASPAGEQISVRDAGLSTPESALHDRVADVYLVANINGGPSEKSNNGFISRISPDGAVEELRWIEGGRDGVVLHSPKGTALLGDSLFVADIDTVRIFHRETGAAIDGWGVPGATFLNDVAVGPDGSVYVSDTGIRIGPDGMQETGSDAVYRFSGDGEAEAIARGVELGRPNGLVADESGVVMVGFGGNQVVHIMSDGAVHPMVTLPAGQLDGVVRHADGSLLVSSWEAQAVYRIDSGGEVTAVVEGVEAPAAIGYDETRNRVLIPLFMQDALEIRTLP